MAAHNHTVCSPDLGNGKKDITRCAPHYKRRKPGMAGGKRKGGKTGTKGKLVKQRETRNKGRRIVPFWPLGGIRRGRTTNRDARKKKRDPMQKLEKRGKELKKKTVEGTRLTARRVEKLPEKEGKGSERRKTGRSLWTRERVCRGKKQGEKYRKN